jgi:hypothetical protein
MTATPKVFISATSGDLATARKAAAQARKALDEIRYRMILASAGQKDLSPAERYERALDEVVFMPSVSKEELAKRKNYAGLLKGMGVPDADIEFCTDAILRGEDPGPVVGK